MKFKGKAAKKQSKDNVKINNENVFFKYLKCYKEFFFRKQILLFIVCLVIFFIAFTIGMSTIDFNAPLKKDVNEFANINLIQIQFIFVMVLTPFLALIPFVKKLSIVTVFYSYFMAFNVTKMFYLPTCNNILLAIFVIFSLFALSINLLLSFELSEMINKKFIKIINIQNKNKISYKEAISENNISKNEKTLYLKRNVTIITFITCIILSMVSLIITKFI